MDSISRLSMAAVDAVGRKPKAGWRDTLILACDDVEFDFDLMVEALERIATEGWTQKGVFSVRIAAEALAKVKGGEHGD